MATEAPISQAQPASDITNKRDYISKIHLCLNKLEQTPPASPQAAIVLKSILEFIPLRLEKQELRRDDDLRRLFLQRNFFNTLVFYLDSAHGPTVMAAVAVINSLFIRHYIDIPTTIRIYLPSLFKAMANTQLPSEQDTIRFLHNMLAFITMLLNACEQMDSQKQTIFYNMFKTEFAIKSLQYTFQRFLLFFTRHWYDATLTEEQLLELDQKTSQQQKDAKNESTTTSSTTDTTATTTTQEQQNGDITDGNESSLESKTNDALQTIKQKVKSSQYTPKESMDLFYQGIQLLLFPFVGFINILILNTTPSDLIVSIFTEMLYLSRDFLYKTCICTVPILCTGEKYYFTYQQSMVQMSFYQLYFQTLLIIFRCATIDTFERTRRKVLVGNWVFQTMLYFVTVYHQSLLPDGETSDQINYIKQTLQEYKDREKDPEVIAKNNNKKNKLPLTTKLDEIDEAPLFQEQDIDHMAKALKEEQKQEQNNNDTTTTTNINGDKIDDENDAHDIISVDFLQYSLPHISTMIFGISRRMFPTQQDVEVSIHYDICRALCFSGYFRYLYGLEILFPRQHQNDLLNLSPQYIPQTAKAHREEEQEYLIQYKEKLNQEQKLQQNQDTTTDTHFSDPNNSPPTAKSYTAKYLFPGALYSEQGILTSIFATPETFQTNPNDETKDTNDATLIDPTVNNKTGTKPSDISEDYLAILWMSFTLLNMCDYQSEPTHKPPHPSGYVQRDKEGVPIRDMGEFARYFIHNCQLYQFILRWLSLDCDFFQNGVFIPQGSNNTVTTTTSTNTKRNNKNGPKERVLHDLSWEILESAILPSADYEVAGKHILSKVIASFKQQQYDEMTLFKESPTKLSLYVHEFWAWKNRRIHHAIQLKEKAAKEVAEKANNEQGGDKKDTTTSKTSQLQFADQTTQLDGHMEETDIDEALKKEETMRKQIRIETEALNDTNDGSKSVVVTTDDDKTTTATTTTVSTTDNESMPSLEEASNTSTILSENGDNDNKVETEQDKKKKLYAETRQRIREQSHENATKFSELYEYDFPHNFLELTPFQLVQFTHNILRFKPIYIEKEKLHFESLHEKKKLHDEEMKEKKLRGEEVIPFKLEQNDLKVPLTPDEEKQFNACRQLDEDLTVFLMTKAPITFQYYGVPFYFFEKPTMDKKIPVEQTFLDHATIFTPEFFQLLQLLTATTNYSTFNYSIDQFVMSEMSVNYFTYAISLYQQSRASLNEEPLLVSRTIKKHIQSIMYGIVNTQLEPAVAKSFDLYKTVGTGGVRFDSHRLEPNGTATKVTASSLSDIIGNEQVTQTSTTTTTSLQNQHEIILNEYGESEYVRGLDRNLLPINLDEHETTVAQSLFNLLTEMKLLCKRAQIFDDTEIIVDDETALTIPNDKYGKMVQRVISAKKNSELKAKEEKDFITDLDEKFKNGEITEDEFKQAHKTHYEEMKKKNTFKTTIEPTETPKIEDKSTTPESESKPTSSVNDDDDTPPALEQVEEDDYLGDDPVGEMIDPNDPTKIISRQTKVRTAETYRFKPSVGTMQIKRGLVFDTQDQNTKNEDKLMTFNFNLLRPDPLEKHEYQTFKFSDRSTADPGVSEYIQHTLDHEKERDFLLRQMKYFKNSFFFEGVGFRRKIENERRQTQADEFQLHKTNLIQRLKDSRENKKLLIADVLATADKIASETDDGETTSASAVATELEDIGVKLNNQYSDDEELLQNNKPSIRESYDDDFVDEDTELEFFLRGVTPPSDTNTIQRNQQRVQQLEYKQQQETIQKLVSKIKNEDQQMDKIVRVGRRIQGLQTGSSGLTSHKPSTSNQQPLTPTEIAFKRETLTIRLKELHGLRSKIIAQVQNVEEGLFPPERPLPEKDDRTSTLFIEFKNDLTKFEAFKQQQIVKLKQIDLLSQKLVDDFKAETEDAMTLLREKQSGSEDGNKKVPVDTFKPQQKFDFPQPTSNDALKAAEEFDIFANTTSNENGNKPTTTTPTTTKKSNSDPVDSDLEDYEKDQEAMKKHWQEQQRIRMGLPPTSTSSTTTTSKSTTSTATATTTTGSSTTKTQSNTTQPKEITHSLTLPPPTPKTASPHSNDYQLTAETVPSFTTLPTNSILRHNPSKPFSPRQLPVIFPWDSKYVPNCLTKPLTDKEVWVSPENNFDWLDEDPRLGTTSYGDKTIQKELDRRINSNDDVLNMIDSIGNTNGKDDGDLTDVFDALNKKKKAIVDSNAKDKAILRKNPIHQQDLDVTREQLESLYFAAKTWTYEELYLHFLRFDQQTIYQMKRSMEYFLRLNLPSDFKDLQLKKGVTYSRAINDEPEYKPIGEKDDKKSDTKPKSVTADNNNDDDDNDDKEDPHTGLSVTENEEVAKQEKLGDEDKFFARVAVRRQKLIARFQLPALYRYIHERINDIPPPRLVASIFGREPGQQKQSQQSLLRHQTLDSVDKLSPEEQQILLRYRQQQMQQRANIASDREPSPQELEALRYAHLEQQRRRQQQQAFLQSQQGPLPSTLPSRQPQQQSPLQQPTQRTASQPPQSKPQSKPSTQSSSSTTTKKGKK